MRPRSFATFFIGVGLCLFLFAHTALAVSVQIVEYPKDITENEFEVKFEVTGAKKAKNYFRVLLYSESPSKILAETWNGNSWVGSADSKLYFPLEISSGTVASSIKSKVIPEIESGVYKLKIKRFTESGNAAQNDNSNEVSLNFVKTKASSAKPEPTSISSTPQATRQVEPQAQNTDEKGIPTLTPSVEEQKTEEVSLNYIDREVLPSKEEEEKENVESGEVKGLSNETAEKNDFWFVPGILGGAMMGWGAILVKKKLHNV